VVTHNPVDLPFRGFHRPSMSPRPGSCRPVGLHLVCKVSAPFSAADPAL
jgi:hypothetical protein